MVSVLPRTSFYGFDFKVYFQVYSPKNNMFPKSNLTSSTRQVRKLKDSI